MVRVESLVVSLFQSNCFIVRNGDDPAAVVIDPGDDAERIADHLRREGCTVAAYLLTHGHVDHVNALADLYRLFPAPVALHPADARWAFTERAAFPPYYDAPEAPPEIARSLADGQEWNDIGLDYRVIATPGHSPGGVAFHFYHEGILFGGDSLFRGSIGRSDLPGSQPQDLAASLRKLMALPPETVVYCGHGPATTIGDEVKRNPFLRSFDWAG